MVRRLWRWLNRGYQQYQRGDFLGAIVSYDYALNIKSDLHKAWYYRGSALGNLGRRESAIASYDSALKIKPDYHEAWNNRGIVLGANPLEMFVVR